MVASSVRALNADVEFGFALAQQLTKLGQPLYRKQEPTGYAARFGVEQDTQSIARGILLADLSDEARGVIENALKTL